MGGVVVKRRARSETEAKGLEGVYQRTEKQQGSRGRKRGKGKPAVCEQLCDAIQFSRKAGTSFSFHG